MIFSKGTGYALRALIFLAEHMDEGPFLAGAIADDIDVPKPTLSKILNRLAAKKLVKSVSGPNGGFWLVKDPGLISLKEIYEAFEPSRSYQECLLGHPQCPGTKYCTLHLKWLEPQKHIFDFLNNTKISDIIPFEDGLQPEDIPLEDQ
ncbi:MAG: Rrf2 family transcriptional regulator [Candidatus Electryonea clarkiae]|nr:Rrf2 family transcriptional regulator [Candidatus Electryonea clarkiae]MDP8287753.1 Rrf2 family transcriptional regulator [Candidatus Electryonea clarkiae]